MGGETPGARIDWVADSAIRCEYAALGLIAANGAARALYETLREAAFEEVVDLVPGATSLLVLLSPGIEPSRALLRELERRPDARAARAARGGDHAIDVRYGGQSGPDLADLAKLLRIKEKDVVARHSGAPYTVAFVGFSPGFPYLVGLPEELHAPRLATPRTRVPAGSVAIGGAFTGIYPRATPGGWRILGQASAVLFDPAAEPPTRLAPGDRVRFVPR